MHKTLRSGQNDGILMILLLEGMEGCDQQEKPLCGNLFIYF